MTDFEPEQLLHFGGPKNSLREHPRVDQSQGSRPLIEEEGAGGEDDDLHQGLWAGKVE